MGNDTKILVKILMFGAICIGMALFLGIAVSLLLAPGRASAASAYDNIIESTDTLKLSYDSTELDISLNYAGYIRNEVPNVVAGGACENNDIPTMFNNATSWVVVQSMRSDNNKKIVLYSYTMEEDPTPLEFSGTPGQGSLTFPLPNEFDGFYGYLELNSDGETVTNNCWTSSSSIFYYTSMKGGTGTNWSQPFIVNYPVNYPEGYAGEVPPSTQDPPVEPNHLKPEFLFISSEQWKGRFMDTNLATYDGISEFYTVCDDDLAPIIVGNITNGTWLQEFSVSATAQVEVRLPESTSPQDFTITGRYSCAGHGPEFDTDGVYEFTITQFGTLDNNFMKDCVNMEEPSLDFGACIENVQNIMGLLTFGQLKLNKNFENIDSIQCRNLQVLGSWIFKPGAYVCPAIPSFVRNTITPFVLLALGYGAANFLRKRNETI